MSPDPMVPVKVGVIGIGNMGWHHARVLSLLRDADLVGVADPDAERGKLATEQFGCRWFADYNAMLSEVEAVCIAVPTLLHHPVGLACLRAGVHVLIEKPIAASQDDANRVSYTCFPNPARIVHFAGSSLESPISTEQLKQRFSVFTAQIL